MLLWVCLAILTAITIMLILRPLTVENVELRDAASADIEVYKDQLAEIDTDLDRGLINAEEAEAARTELSRRLLSRSDPEDGGAESINAPRGAGQAVYQRLGLVLCVLLPLISVGFYLGVGSPGMPAKPHAERMQVSAENATAEELIAKVEAQLRKNPEDGRGWAVLAPVYKRLNRYGEASNAFAQTIRLMGETPERLVGLAQAEILAQNGLVNERSKLAFRRLLKLQPDNSEAKFWLAQAQEQDGDIPGAIEKYKAMLASGPADAPWRPSVEQRVAALTGLSQGGGSSAAVGAGNQGEPAPGPNAEDVKAASEMSEAQRAEFITSMVTRLAARLKENGNDAGGWKRLIRAYMVMGKQNEARSAMRDARKAFATDLEMQMEFDALAKGLGL